MVPFYDFTTMTAQEVFDASLNHIRKQGCKSSYLGKCLYYGGDNGRLGCAAAIFIPYESRDRADSVMGSWKPYVLKNHTPESYEGDVYSHERLICAIQGAHDNVSVDLPSSLFLEGFEYNMKNVARIFNLEYNKQEQTNV